MVVSAVSKGLRKVFGSRNDRLIKGYSRRVLDIAGLEEQTRKLTDAELRAKTQEFRDRINQGEKATAVQPEVMAVAREAMDRAVGMRSIFNPEFGFDPSQLKHEAKKLYDQVQAQIAQLEDIEVRGCAEPTPGWMQVEIPNALYDAVRELYPKSKPPFRCRPFDVQLIGGMVLGEGKIAEMKTGEGKTIVAPLACYLACVEELQCHVVTVNDYLVQRDRDWVFPFFHWLGLSVGSVHPFHMQPGEKKAEAYTCDVVYGTNSEFGFDYLRDNMKLSPEEQVQKRRDFCIIDEVDSILIDEARTPLIISGPAHDDAPRYGLADQLARHLMQQQRVWDAANERFQKAFKEAKALEGDIRNTRDKGNVPAMKEKLAQLEAEAEKLELERDQHVQYYEIEMEKKAAHLTHDGIAEAQKVADIGSFYVGNNIDVPHLLENALRAHVVYQRDRDYVVQQGEVVIVDENTGRLMIGRQWSDGLHQSVEAKEKVKIKEETQTLATVTIQNFFKLFKRLAGMTGTAVTESTEFGEVYKLEVVCIPTNLPVIREDRDDLIFMSEKDKWYAILDEIKLLHDVGRPVLVGTTSVQKSEMLSDMLTKKHGIQHEVLNAKAENAEREGNIVENAGAVGAVMIATNMAGRGTDIKLQRIPREALVAHWQKRSILPSEARPEMDDDQIIELAYRHLATKLLKMKKDEAKNAPLDQIKLDLMRYWVGRETYYGEGKAATMSAEQCEDVLDKTPNFFMHRLKIFTNIEEMGGLHIIGTERHEARRIDNQLRGRAGRQGDHGSSRFFISLEDDLMQLFAGNMTKAALSRLGMKEGDAIEHRWITKSVERAQRKVEERNYEVRKSLLEYDEVMEHQRGFFYGIRQEVLENKKVRELVFGYIDDAVQDAVAQYLDKDYVPTQIAEWVTQSIGASIEPFKLRQGDFDELSRLIKKEAAVDVRHTVDTTIGEYMGHDIPPEEWDLRGLCRWAQSAFKVDLKQNQVRRMNVEEVKDQLVAGGVKLIDKQDLSDLNKYLVNHYAEQELAGWAKEKFDLELDAEKLAGFTDKQEVIEFVLDKARETYREREITYPIEFMLEWTFQAAEQDGQWAAENLCEWANQRYDLSWKPEQVKEMTGSEISEALAAEAKKFYDGGMEKLIDEAMVRQHNDARKLSEWAERRFGKAVDLTAMETEAARREALIDAGFDMLRTELAELERFVLLQVLDQAWKDHLYEMDKLKDSVGLRGYAEKDPRIEYKREGANHFAMMQSMIVDKVTDLIFRARLTPNVEMRNVYGEQEAEHAEAEGVLAGSPAGSSGNQGTAEQQANIAAAERAGTRGDDDMDGMSRKQRRAAQARDRRGGGGGGKRRRRGR